MTEVVEEKKAAVGKPKDLVQEVSVTALHKEGFQAEFTLRDYDTNPLVVRLAALLDWLPGHGFSGLPVPVAPEPVVVNVASGRPDGAKDQDEGPEQGDGAPPTCPTHHKPMKKSNRGGWYCPVKIADDDGTGKPVYCKQKAS